MITEPWRHLGGAVGQSWVKSRKKKEVLLTLPTNITNELMWTFRSLSSHFIVFPECVARVPVSLWGSGGWGCVRSTSRNRSQPSATVHARPVWPCLWQVLHQWSLLQVSSIALLRFACRRGTSWHSNVCCNVSKNRFVWQAQYFCDVFRRCVAVFVAGAALWRPPSPFRVAGAAL